MEDFLAWDVTKGSRLKSAIQLEYAGVGRGITMKKRIVIALLATSFAAGTSFAADWPFAAPPQLYRAGSLPVDWTGLYFGVNAGYGSASGSSTTAFTGAFSGTNLVGSSSLRGGIAGGQIGSNWQAGMFVFGGEVDFQWSGQQATASVVCTPGCIASEAVNIKLFATGRARIGLAFDWFLPYVTAGGALVSAQDKLTMTVGGITGNFNALSNNTAGWTAGAGFDVALSSNWSARFEYLHISTNNLNATAPIPAVLGVGTASESAAGYRDNIVRAGLNYRFGPRGGPGVLETALSPPAYALNHDSLPDK
jgi:outer membrane immunogenic protein